jgi:hypothetical protein
VSARYILVIEKDAIFQRLAEDRLHERLPLVLVTAKGNPDLATRAFICRCGCVSPPETACGPEFCVGNEHIPLGCLAVCSPAGIANSNHLDLQLQR